MFKRLISQGPAFADIVRARLQIAQVRRLDAQAEFERAKANLTMYQTREAQLTHELERLIPDQI